MKKGKLKKRHAFLWITTVLLFAISLVQTTVFLAFLTGIAPSVGNLEGEGAEPGGAFFALSLLLDPVFILPIAFVLTLVSLALYLGCRSYADYVEDPMPRVTRNANLALLIVATVMNLTRFVVFYLL